MYQVSTTLNDEHWLNLITQCRSSGLTDRQWCIENGIPVSTFYYHVRALRKKACEVPEAVDETGLTDYAPYVNTASYPGMGYFYAKSVEVYGGATVMVDFPVWKLSAGTYKVHFCLKDGGVYSPIAEKNLCKIEIKAKPDHEFVVLTEPLTFPLRR